MGLLELNLSNVEVRAATLADLEGLMAVEKQTFDPIGAGAACDREMFERRIRLCNAGETKWFFLAENQGVIVGYMILIPTAMQPDECDSWGTATGNGNLGTFNPEGENVYVVSLAAIEDGPAETSVLLVQHSFGLWGGHGGRYMFCSRMPGFAAANRRDGITADAYWRATREDGTPRDGMLHLYTCMGGGQGPVRLLENGWKPDMESGGHGVLFAFEDQPRAMKAIGEMISGGSD